MPGFAALMDRTNEAVADRLFDVTIEIDGRSVQARRDEPYAESVGVASRSRSVRVLAADGDGVLIDTPVILAGEDYLVASTEPDGDGMVVLRLRKA